MEHPTTSGWRRALAAVLIVALTLAGTGRAMAVAAVPFDVPPGLGAPICHSGGSEAPAEPGAPSRHDCCDACALLAPALLPTAPSLAAPVPAGRPAARSGITPGAPAASRPHSPRQSQGPPAA